MSIILDVNPYSKKAMTIEKLVEQEVQAIIKSGELNAKIAIDGKTSQNVDLEEIVSVMMRYRELDGHSTQAFVDAARHIGGVIISAAIILGVHLRH